MNENVSQTSIEISKDEAEAIDTGTSLIVHIWPSKSLINATNLLAVRRYDRRQLPSLLAGSKIHSVHCRAYGMQGKYISYANGDRLCDALELSEDRLSQIKDAIREGWLGPLVDVQHGSNVGFGVVKSKMAAEKEKRPEFLLSRANISSYACSTISDSKKLSRNSGGGNLDDQYYEGLSDPNPLHWQA
jgi:hypothetical protein